MNSAVVWTVGGFLGGRILERVVAGALGSTSGRRLMQRWDKRELTPSSIVCWRNNGRAGLPRPVSPPDLS